MEQRYSRTCRERKRMKNVPLPSNCGAASQQERKALCESRATSDKGHKEGTCVLVLGCSPLQRPQLAVTQVN